MPAATQFASDGVDVYPPARAQANANTIALLSQQQRYVDALE
jgi:hypothetical protein